MGDEYFERQAKKQALELHSEIIRKAFNTMLADKVNVETVADLKGKHSDFRVEYIDIFERRSELTVEGKCDWYLDPSDPEPRFAIELIGSTSDEVWMRMDSRTEPLPEQLRSEGCFDMHAVYCKRVREKIAGPRHKSDGLAICEVQKNHFVSLVHGGQKEALVVRLTDLQKWIQSNLDSFRLFKASKNRGYCSVGVSVEWGRLRCAVNNGDINGKFFSTSDIERLPSAAKKSYDEAFEIVKEERKARQQAA